MNTLFVTSFSPDLYEATGKWLIESFNAVQTAAADTLLCCVEGPLAAKVTGPRIKTYNLDQDNFLRDWLNRNADIIPDYLGGLAVPCSCPNTEKRHAKHPKFGCHWQWMNRNASRFFRKVASLNIAADIVKRTTQKEVGGHIVWLDSDCRFVEMVDPVWLNRVLGRAAMAYCKGHRPAVESGILVFDAITGPRFIWELGDRYTSGRFRKDERWDDGFQIAQLIKETKVPTRDLVHPTKWAKGPERTNNVIPTTILSERLEHDKGSHGTKLDIMK